MKRLGGVSCCLTIYSAPYYTKYLDCTLAVHEGADQAKWSERGEWTDRAGVFGLPVDGVVH